MAKSGTTGVIKNSLVDRLQMNVVGIAQQKYLVTGLKFQQHLIFFFRNIEQHGIPSSVNLGISDLTIQEGSNVGTKIIVTQHSFLVFIKKRMFRNFCFDFFNRAIGEAGKCPIGSAYIQVDDHSTQVEDEIFNFVRDQNCMIKRKYVTLQLLFKKGP